MLARQPTSIAAWLSPTLAGVFPARVALMVDKRAIAHLRLALFLVVAAVRLLGLAVVVLVEAVQQARMETVLGGMYLLVTKVVLAAAHLMVVRLVLVRLVTMALPVGRVLPVFPAGLAERQAGPLRQEATAVRDQAAAAALRMLVAVITVAQARRRIIGSLAASGMAQAQAAAAAAAMVRSQSVTAAMAAGLAVRAAAGVIPSLLRFTVEAGMDRTV